MNRTFSLLALSLAAATLAYITTISADAQGPTPIPSVWLQNATPGTAQTGNVNVNGTMKAGQFEGGGAGLTNLDASALATGTLPDARLSSNAALLNTAQTFTEAKTFSLAPSFTAAGSPFSVTSSTLVTNLNADLLDGLDSTAFLQSIPVPLTLSGSSATHIIEGYNISPLDGASSIVGSAAATSGITYGVYASNQSTSGRGVFGLASPASGFNYGVYGQSNSSSGQGVFGLAFAASGTTYGVQGQSNSTSGQGVFGLATAASGTTYGVQGQSNSTSGRGVFGHTTATSGTTYGVQGQSDSTSGRGVFGHATAASGGTYGGRFESDSTLGIGVYGSATATSNLVYGVYGRSASTSGRGVFGYAAAGSGTIYGVYGQAAIAAAGYAVYAAGDMGASGVKSFRIDHPFDPENKYLLHYSTESPMPQNFYVGNVVTDSRGYAWVELPDYFAEINTNFKYQLTVISGEEAFVHVMVSKEIRENRFQVRTSAPNTKVSWRIDADRNDLYVRRKEPKDVIDKEGVERGTYQHPELYGEPKERGMNYRPEFPVANKRR